MKFLSRSAMAEILRLTQSGNVVGATFQILANLAQETPASASKRRKPGVAIRKQPRAARSKRTAAHGEESPSEGRFERRLYDGPAGRLDYFLYKPAGSTSGRPLILMLHGCTQSPEDFARGTRMNLLADEYGFLVGYPAQSHSANAQKCWNWFRPEDQRRDAGEPAMMAGIVGQLIAEEQVDATRVYVAGMSAGGAAAAVLAAVYPDLFAAIGIHSGLPCGAATSIPGAFAAMRNGGDRRDRPPRSGRAVPVITFHGDRDDTVSAANSDRIVEEALDAGGSALKRSRLTGEEPGGRRFTREMHSNSADDIVIEKWTVEGAGHGWAGGDSAGSYVDPKGPDASRAMVRFFFSHRMGPSAN